MCTNCNQPPCANPCNKCGGCVCTCSSLYSSVGCLNITPSDCVQYSGLSDLSCIGIKRNDSITSAISSLATYSTGILGKISSSSLYLTLQGTCSDYLSIEMVPSTTVGNILGYGSDGRPYVPKTDVNIVAAPCFSFQKTVNGQTITLVPIIDWNCVAQQTCVLCSNPSPCVAPTGLIVQSTGQTTAQIGWNSVAGVTYNVLVNGVVQTTNVTSPYTFNSLIAGTTYSLTIRAVCSSGTTADTTLSVTTLPITSCVLPSAMNININVGTAAITWTPGGGGGTQAIDYKLNSASTYTTYSTVPSTNASVSIPGLTHNVLYTFRITNNCSGGTAAATSGQGIDIDCVTVTTVTTNSSIAASFAPLGGDISQYVVTLYDSTGVTTIQSQTFTGPFDTSVNATFTSLTASTSYLIGVVPSVGSFANASCTKTTSATTAIPGCPLPTNLTVTLN